MFHTPLKRLLGRNRVVSSEQQYAMLFNGESAVIDMGSAAELDNLHDGIFTVDGWFNTDGTQLGALVSKGYSNGGWAIYIEAAGTLIFRVLCATHNSERQTAGTYNDGEWHHFAAYFNDGAGADRKVSFAIDGVWEEIGDLAVDAIQTDATKPLTVGRLSGGAVWWYDGKMGWYRISDNDRLGHGVNFAGSIPPRTTTPEVDGNTVGLWPINEGEGAVANDISANENDGTITDGVWTELIGDRMRGSSAFLRMTENDGEDPWSTSDESYELGKDLLDIIYPINGGKLQDDGTWLQQGYLIDHEFPQALRQMAVDNGQLYIPVVNQNSFAELNTVLESTPLQETAADNLVTLATTRFDAPWDGVCLNLEGTSVENEDAMSDFFYILEDALHTAGLKVAISLGGRVEDDDTIFTTLDYKVVGEIADIVELCIYSYREPLPISIAPHWYIDTCIQYALGDGVQRGKIYLCLGTYAKHWPDPLSSPFDSLTYQQALDMAEGNPTEWIESNEHGLVREMRATLPDDSVLWFHNAETLGHGLDLVDKYNLKGVGMFITGCEDLAVWPLIEAWK